MLVLSRRPNESIVIGGNIRVTILRSTSGIVRLGIDAPVEIAVHREEIQTQIQNEQLSSQRGTARQASSGSLENGHFNGRSRSPRRFS